MVCFIDDYTQSIESGPIFKILFLFASISVFINPIIINAIEVIDAIEAIDVIDVIDACNRINLSC